MRKKINKTFECFVEILFFFVEWCYVIFKFFIGATALYMFYYIASVEGNEISLLTMKILHFTFMGYVAWIAMGFNLKYIFKIMKDK